MQKTNATYSPWTYSHHRYSITDMKEEDSDNGILYTFGQKVRQHRKNRSMSQEELGDSCQLDRTYIGSVERGERNISLLNIYRIAAALELDVKELFVHDE